MKMFTHHPQAAMFLDVLGQTFPGLGVWGSQD